MASSARRDCTYRRRWRYLFFTTAQSAFFQITDEHLSSVPIKKCQEIHDTQKRNHAEVDFGDQFPLGSMRRTHNPQLIIFGISMRKVWIVMIAAFDATDAGVGGIRVLWRHPNVKTRHNGRGSTLHTHFRLWPSLASGFLSRRNVV